MKLGFKTSTKHISFNRCLRVVSLSLPWFGEKDLFSWDSSKKEALSNRKMEVGSTLSDYLEQLPSQWD